MSSLFLSISGEDHGNTDEDVDYVHVNRDRVIDGIVRARLRKVDNGK